MQLYRGRFLVRAKLHEQEERYRQALSEEIVPLRHQRGLRTYVHAKPYLLVPDITLDIRTYPRPDARGAAGEVIGSEFQGMRHEEVGQAQAWYYHEDRTLVLWEAFLEDRFRRPDPGEDANTRTLWRWLEAHLRDRFPEAARLVTPFADPIYDTRQYQAFLNSLDYHPVAAAAFGKRFPSPR